MRNPRQVLTRSVIFERVWGYDFGYGSNSLDVYIGYLRRKTEAGGEPQADPDGARRRLRPARGVVSFRVRLILVAAAAVALAVVAASSVVYVVVRNQLRERARLRASAAARAGRAGRPADRERAERAASLDPGPLAESVGYIQAVRADGTVFKPFRAERAAAGRPGGRSRPPAAGRAAYFADARIGGSSGASSRSRAETGYAVQIARSVDEVESHAAPCRRSTLILIALGGIARGGRPRARGRADRARAGAAPDPDGGERRARPGISRSGSRRAARTSSAGWRASFNTMLAALERVEQGAQRQLVADASHELRTPLTSLRTNIEVLAGERTASLRATARSCSATSSSSSSEMTSLIADAGRARPRRAAPARGGGPAPRPGRRRRGRARAAEPPNVTFKTDFGESLVHGVPATIERAVANLLDNAAKWSPPGGDVEVGVRTRAR